MREAAILTRTCNDRGRLLIAGLDLPDVTGIEGARWQSYQRDFLADDSPFTIDAKGRQIGWSFTAALDALADAILVPQHTAIFVSINLEEAVEKIRYAKRAYDSLSHTFDLPALEKDTETQLHFKNGSRLISHPSKPPRGKRATVYLDELAHCQHDRAIYQAAVPMTTRGGRIRIGSTPLGANGIFWEIYAQEMAADLPSGRKQYDEFKRRFLPWWVVRELCRDRQAAVQAAPGMATMERVYTFGTDHLIAIHENMPEEDFRQEYEVAFLDEMLAWIAWEHIKACQAGWTVQYDEDEDGEPLPVVGTDRCELTFFAARSVDAGLEAIDQLAEAIRRGDCGRRLYLGVDVGRVKDLTEIIVVEQSGGQCLYRLGISLAGISFEQQREVMTKLLRRLPVVAGWIDQSGIGRQLAEELENRFGTRAEGVDFTNDRKELWAVEMKLAFEKRRITIPPDRELAYQIHSIKRKTTAAKHTVYDTDANEKAHADKFWALALALYLAREASGNLGSDVRESLAREAPMVNEAARGRSQGQKPAGIARRASGSGRIGTLGG